MKGSDCGLLGGGEMSKDQDQTMTKKVAILDSVLIFRALVVTSFPAVSTGEQSHQLSN